MLEPAGGAKRVTIVLRALKDEHGGYVHLIEELRRLGAAEATAFQGIASFVGQNPVHTNRVVDFVPELPVIIIWIDRADTVDAILPQIVPLIRDGIVTVDETRVVLHTSTEISDLPRGQRVQDVMTHDVVYVHADTPMPEMIERLARQKFRALPVVDEQSRVIGIVTNGDLVRRGGLSVRMELLQAMREEDRAQMLQDVRDLAKVARDVMTKGPVTTTPDTTIRDAARVMLRHQLKRIPVVDADGRLIGMVSRIDVLKTVTTPGIEKYQNGAPSAPESAAAPITRVMTKDVPVVAPGDPVPQLINVVVSTRLNRAVVVDDKRRPIGIVSDAELIERVTPEARPSVLTAVMHRLPLLHGTPETQEMLHHARGKVARDFMRKNFLQVSDTATIGESLERMLSEGRKIVIIVDADGALLGMADRRDLLGALA